MTPLAPGATVGPFEIVAPLGRGGMGEVWRARDTKLRRDVAIKALPAEVAHDPERRARFEREARMLAALNHPNVAAIYGLEASGEALFLVLELVEGETLEGLLAKGPLSLGETLSLAIQVAAGLEGAHEAGVIHRDLKPANVKVRPDGSVKILDLGLARSTTTSGVGSAVTEHATMTSDGTGPGVILGTAPYMSPEQARGRVLDQRTDIFSFGGLVFECLTGRRAFHGRTLSDVLAAVLTAEPEWSALPGSTPPRLRALVQRCLQKDLKQRVHHIADARLELEEIRIGLSSTEAPASLAPDPWPRLSRAAGGAALVVVGSVAGLLAGRELRNPTAPSAAAPVRAELPLPEGVNLGPLNRPALAISPDGRTIVFRAGSPGGPSSLWKRALDGTAAEPIAGTERGYEPFFSPDGQWLGFFTLDAMKKIPLVGGTAVTITDMPPVSQGAAWLADGSIVLSRTANAGLQRVAAPGAKAEPFTTLDAARGEHSHNWPQALPGGRRVLFMVVRGRDFQDIDSSEAQVFEPGTSKRTVLVEGCAFARYVGNGWIVFLRGRSLFAVPFDPDGLALTGPPVPIPEPVTTALTGSSRIAHVAGSAQGALLYASGPPVREATTRVVRYDRHGNGTPVPMPPGNTRHPRVSPDGKQLAVMRCADAVCKLHVFDLERQVLSLLTSEPGRYFEPAWSPDGRRVAFTQFNVGEPALGFKAADGSGLVEGLSLPAEAAYFAGGYSPDGTLFAYTTHHPPDAAAARPAANSDIWLLPLDGRGPPRRWLESPFNEFGAEFSPDGQWMAYVSNETGRNEVYVRPFPGPGGKLKVSAEGGAEVAWSRGGREILFRRGDDLMAVDFKPGKEPAAGVPRVLFTSKALDRGGRIDWPREYDVLKDGAEILAIEVEPVQPQPRKLAIVTNWAATLARAATAR